MLKSECLIIDDVSMIGEKSIYSLKHPKEQCAFLGHSNSVM